MKRLIIITVALLLLLCVSSMATETRTMTMGDNNMVLLDDANIFLFPSRVNEYPNLAVGEFSGNSFNKFGIHWKFGDDNPWVWATYFSTESATGPRFLLNDSSMVVWDYDEIDSLWLPDGAGLPPNYRIQSIYGRELGGYKFGFGLEWLRSGGKDDYTDNQAQESFNFFDVTFGLTEATGLWDVALNIGAGSWTDKSADGKNETESDGFMDLELAGRYFKAGPTYTWIPHASLSYQKRGVKENYLDTLNGGGPLDLGTHDLTTNDTRLGFELGMGLNYEPAKNVLAVADFGFRWDKGKRTWDTTATTPAAIGQPDEASIKTFTLPYWKIGLDADVFSWMDIRFGATSDWNSASLQAKDGGDDLKRSNSSASNKTYLGFGFHFGRLHIDTQTDPDLFLRGFDFINGKGTGNDMNMSISAVYEMM